MVGRVLPLVIAVLLAVPATPAAQMTFRLRGTVAAISGLLGEQTTGIK